jgi:hypothetical protein
MQQISENPNLHIFPHNDFNGFGIQLNHRPYVKEYLDRLWQTIEKATWEYPRTFAARFDLRFPSNILIDTSNAVISDFFESLKAKIAHDRQRSAKRHDRVHDTRLRYVWAREYGEHGIPHFHCLILLNHDAYYKLGQPYSETEKNTETLFTRIQGAWAQALGLSLTEASGLVYRPPNAEYFINSNNGVSSIGDLFYRCSYMCKTKTKHFSDGFHSFGCSRI